MSERPHVVVLDDHENVMMSLADWQPVRALAQISHHTQPLRGAALLDAVREADALVLMRDRTPLTAELIAQLPRLKYVVFTGTRNNALDRAALARRGIPVSHTAWGPSKEATTELTWALILAAQRRLDAHVNSLRSGAWQAPRPLGGVLHGQRLGLIGLGEIGSRVAAVGRAFGMEVVCWSPNMTPKRAQAHGAQAVTLDTLLASAQVVSLHLVASASTRHVINASRLAQMRDDAWLVNTSRASLVDTDALVQALAAGRPAGAALDVFDEEPLPAQHGLLQAPNVLLTPHLGFVAEPVFTRFAQGVVESLTAWLTHAPLVRELPAP